MNIFDFYQKKIVETIKKNKKILKISEVNFDGMQVELAPEKFNCDISTNIAMLLTKRYKKNLQTFTHDLRDIVRHDKSSRYITSSLASTENTEVVNP